MLIGTLYQAPKEKPKTNNSSQKNTSLNQDVQNSKIHKPANTMHLKRYAGLFILVSFVTILAAFFYNNGKHISTAEKSIAILQFEDLSKDSDLAYFSSGITEEIIHALLQLPELTVIPKRNTKSSQNSNRTIQEMGEDLNAAYILDGSIGRESNLLKINIRLVRTSDGKHIWKDSFNTDKENIFKIQENIARGVMSSLNIYLDPEQRETMFSFGTKNVKAYEHYLKGRHILKFWHERQSGDDIWVAQTEFEAAVLEDPKMSKAWFHMSDAYYHFAAGDIKEPVLESNVFAPDSSLSALERIQFVLNKSEEHAKTNAESEQSRLNSIFFSNDWADIRSSALIFSSIASKERGELEWLFGPVLLVSLDEQEALQHLLKERILRFDPNNGTGHAYVVRQLLTSSQFDKAKKRIAIANATTFSNRLAEVRGYLLFAINDVDGLREHLEKSNYITPILRDYFSALVLFMDGNEKTARQVLLGSQALRSERVHLAIGLNHMGYKDEAALKFRELDNDPLGPLLTFVVLSYGTACGPEPLPILKHLEQRMLSGNIKPLKCIGAAYQ